MKLKNICAAVMLAGVMLISSCGTAADDGQSFTINNDTSDFTGNIGEVTLEKGDTYALIKVKDFGEIKIKLFTDAVPYATQNFIDLANSGYYTDKNIHRVIGDFMIQGGSLNGDGTGGTAANGDDFKNSINTKLRHFYGALCYASSAGNNSCQFYIVNNKNEQTDLSSMYSDYSEYYAYQGETYEAYIELISDASTQEIFREAAEYYAMAAEAATVMKETLTDEIIEKYKNGGTPSLDGGYTVFGQTVEGFDVIDAITAVETEEGSDGAQSKPVDDVIIESVTIHVVE